MSVNNDESSSSSFETKRGFIIGGLLLLLTGVFYWDHQTSPPASSPKVSSVNADLKAIAAQTGLPIEEKEQAKSAPTLPKPNETRMDADVNETAHLTEAKPTVTERTPSRSTHKNVHSAGQSDMTQSDAARPAEAVVSAPVGKPTSSLPPPAPVTKPEATLTAQPTVATTAPTARSVAAPATALVRAETKKQATAPAELKPTGQPAPVPVTEDIPAVKRKTKNDEDVEVDFK